MSGSSGVARQACAGGLVFDDQGRLLLIQRRNPPGAGLWSVPGGRCRPGEGTEETCVREVAEETGISVRVVSLAGRVELPAPDGGVYDVADYLCRPVGPCHDADLVAGDDASQARWVNLAEFLALPTAPGLYETLRAWGTVPR